MRSSRGCITIQFTSRSTITRISNLATSRGGRANIHTETLPWLALFEALEHGLCALIARGGEGTQLEESGLALVLDFGRQLLERRRRVLRRHAAVVRREEPDELLVALVLLLL